MRARRMNRILSVFAGLFLLASAIGPALQAVEPELRGVWITRFEWPDRNPEVCRAKIVEVLDRAAGANFNAVFLQVRGQADVLYPSPYEPWSPILGAKDPGFDPLQFALTEAHKRGLEFHAYINAFPVWGGKTVPAHTEPEHLFWTHCQPDSKQSWVCHNESGQPMKINEYHYLSPGIPAVQDYIRKVILDVVKRYAVDGIHLDRIRYPSRGVSHDPVSVARFRGPGNPNRLGWEDWQRDQITRMLNHLYGEILMVKPQIKLTSSVWGIYDRTRIPGYGRFSSGYHDYYQDSQRWLQFGVMDALVPMIYWDIPDPTPNYDELLEDFVGNAVERHIYGGYHAKFDFSELRSEIEFTRRAGGQGTVAFASSYLNREKHWNEYPREVYSSRVPTPEMPWKARPTTGAIVGHVHGPGAKPLVDAQIRLHNRNYTWVSSGDGFFACLNLPPGSYTLTARSQDLWPDATTEATVSAGQVTRVELLLPGKKP